MKNLFSSKEVLDNAGIDKIHGFILDRLRAYLKDSSGVTYTTEEIESVLGSNPCVLNDLPNRLAAVRGFLALPEAAPLANANKRIGNILKKIEGDVPQMIDAALLKIPAEKALYDGMQALAPAIEKAYGAQNFTDALKALASISNAVSGFFDDVMVMDPDTSLKNNRLAMLSKLHGQMNQVADLSKLAQ